MAPSTLNVNASGPAGGRGCVREPRSVSAGVRATCVAPAAGQAARRFANEFEVDKVGQFGGRFGKRGDPGAQPDQAFLQAGCEAAGQERQFLIQGEKAGFHRPGRHRSCAAK